MGLIETDTSVARGPGDLGAVRELAMHVRQAGIASGATAALNNVEPPSGEELASGEVWGSRDEGRSWRCLARHLPEIYALETA